MLDDGFIYDVGSDIVAVVISTALVEVHASQKTFFVAEIIGPVLEGGILSLLLAQGRS